MRKLGLTLLLAALATILVVGCGEENPKPSITRLTASSFCGVEPMRVDFRADGTGGTPFAEPTGGNNWLQMNWDFGDGNTIQDGSSIAYHFYSLPDSNPDGSPVESDTFTVTVTAVDDDGNQASRSVEIVVLADTLLMDLWGEVDGVKTSDVEACRPYMLGTTVMTCGFEDGVDSYERFVFEWEVGDAVYTSPNPSHTFEADEVGPQTVYVGLYYPARSLTRRDSMVVNVLPNLGTELTLATDWQPEGESSDTLLRPLPAVFPDTVTYAIRLRNDGAGDAYNITIASALDAFNRIEFLGATTTDGVWEYDGSNDSTWNLPIVASGAEVVAEVTITFNSASAGVSYEFEATLPEYTCDANPAAVTETATLRYQ